MLDLVKDFTANIKLRFFKTEDLYAAFHVLEGVKPKHPLIGEVRKARLRIAREFIRRGEIFW